MVLSQNSPKTAIFHNTIKPILNLIIIIEEIATSLNNENYFLNIQILTKSFADSQST